MATNRIRALTCKLKKPVIGVNELLCRIASRNPSAAVKSSGEGRLEDGQDENVWKKSDYESVSNRSCRSEALGLNAVGILHLQYHGHRREIVSG